MLSSAGCVCLTMCCQIEWVSNNACCNGSRRVSSVFGARNQSHLATRLVTRELDVVCAWWWEVIIALILEKKCGSVRYYSMSRSVTSTMRGLTFWKDDQQWLERTKVLMCPSDMGEAAALVSHLKGKIQQAVTSSATNRLAVIRVLKYLAVPLKRS